MITLESSLENIEDVYCDLNEHFCKFDFCLGGNWEYKNGSLDKHLDQQRKVWLRVPFHVMSGTFDGECDGCIAVIKLGKPFVFGHLYNEGLEDEASITVAGGLFNQFQEPIEQDAEVNPIWVKRAQEVIKQVEQRIVH